MAKINNLEMTENLMTLNDIEVKKGFMGWSIKLIYKPTNSVLKVKVQEYTVEDGKKLASILSSAPENVEAAISKFPVSAVGMGNMKLEACISQDGQFVAAQLLSFKDFSYQPVTEMKVYTGKTAEAFAQLF